MEFRLQEFRLAKWQMQESEKDLSYWKPMDRSWIRLVIWEEAFKSATKSPEQVLFLTGMFPSGKRANYAVDLSQE